MTWTRSRDARRSATGPMSARDACAARPGRPAGTTAPPQSGRSGPSDPSSTGDDSPWKPAAPVESSSLPNAPVATPSGIRHGKDTASPIRGFDRLRLYAPSRPVAKSLTVTQ